MFKHVQPFFPFPVIYSLSSHFQLFKQFPSSSSHVWPLKVTYSHFQTFQSFLIILAMAAMLCHFQLFLMLSIYFSHFQPLKKYHVICCHFPPLQLSPVIWSHYSKLQLFLTMPCIPPLPHFQPFPAI